MNKLLESLNNEQKEAVTHENGPLLIVAGAGTGKTTVLINRLAYLILEKNIKTDEILLMTFTEKSAGELIERADKILPYGYLDLWINTFHGFCERILREHAIDIGLNPDFKLLNTTEQWILLKKNLDSLDLDYYRPLGNPTKFIHELLRHFSRLKDENIIAQEYLKYSEGLEANLDKQMSGGVKSGAKKKGKKDKKSEGEKETDDGEIIDEMEVKRLQELANAFHVYNQLLLDNNALDFGDLITYTLKLFKERPNILKFYQQKFKYVMVDEFQDTNWAQYELVKMLSAKNNNLVVVGDDDQSIYKFRGASISNILQFKDDYSKTKEVVLTKNYRSNQTILDQAYNFIQNNNPNRLETKLKIDKKLISVKDSEEKKKNNILPTVQFYHLNTDQEEAAFVASKILEIYNNPEAFKDKQGGEINWSDFAILIRANDQSEKFIKELSRHNIPNQFISLKGLYYKPIILDCIAYLKLLDNYHESSALFRVLSMDVFKVSYSELVAINKMADRKVWSLFEALQNINAIPNVSAEAVKNINRLFNLINAHSVLAKNDKPSKLFVQFIYDSGLVKYLDHDRDRELFSLLNQFYKKIKEAEEVEKDLRLKGFMERLDMEMAAGESGALQLEYEDADTVRIMTVHAAKGLEFKYVFVVNLVDKRFPSINRGERISIPEALVREKTIISSDIHLEEERRLFYVAMTRAKDILFLTAARDYGGASEKKISRFVPEAALDSREISLDLTANELFRDLIKLENGEVDNKPEVYELPDRFSFSQLAAYSTCPLQYKFNFILKIPVPIDKPSLIFGRVMHNVLQEFLKPLTVGNNKLQADLFGAAKGEVNKNLFNEKKLLELYENYWQNDGYHSKTEREKYKQKGLNSLNIFWQKITENTLPQVNFLEKDFSVKIGDYVLKGKIDRVDKLADGTIEIIDYKTGNPKEKIDWDDKRQLILYQIVMEEVFGIKVSALSYYYLENGEKISFLGKEKEIEKLKLEIISYINEIKKMNFTPTPSQLCDYCDFNGICEFRKR